MSISSKISVASVLLAVLLCGILSVRALAAAAEMAALADKSLLLDGQLVSGRVVVVGERGHILVSDDAGVSWRQRPVPTRATLTSVFFVDERLGWAAGHAAVIVRTTDGGRSWTKLHEEAEGERPILDLWFKDAQTGYAVGAYGLFLVTTDGGETWQERPFSAEPAETAEVDEDGGDDEWFENTVEMGGDVHLNQLRESSTGRLFLAAEAGNIYRSDDGSESWLSLEPPYEGSFFGLLPLDGEALLVYGLRGNLLFSPDAGRSWSFAETGTSASLNDAIRLADGRIVVAGLAGTLLISSDQGRSFSPLPQPDRAGLVRILEVRDGQLLLLGSHGVRRLTLPRPAPLPQVHREGQS